MVSCEMKITKFKGKIDIDILMPLKCCVLILIFEHLVLVCPHSRLHLNWSINLGEARCSCGIQSSLKKILLFISSTLNQNRYFQEKLIVDFTDPLQILFTLHAYGNKNF